MLNNNSSKTLASYSAL